jgi:hypothetical protein
MANLTASTLLPILRDRIAHLADTLAELRHRVREAVAVEMGRIVSETVRDLLTDLLRRSAVDPDATDDPRTAHTARHDDWTNDDKLDRGAGCGADRPPRGKGGVHRPRMVPPRSGECGEAGQWPGKILCVGDQPHGVVTLPSTRVASKSTERTNFRRKVNSQGLHRHGYQSSDSTN